MAKPLRFYYDLVSQPCRALYIFLGHTKIPHEKIRIDFRKGHHRSEPFKAINRFRTLPCIADENFHLAESIAIVRYLAQRYEHQVEPWYPSKDTHQRARIDEYLEWQHMNTRKDCGSYFHYVFYKPLMVGTKVHQDKAEAFKSKMAACLDFLENEYLGERSRYLVGDGFSVADLFAACEVEQTKVTGYDPCAGRPKLTAWMARVRDATNPYYDEAHRDVRCWNRDLSEQQRRSIEACHM